MKGETDNEIKQIWRGLFSLFFCLNYEKQNNKELFQLNVYVKKRRDKWSKYLVHG